VKYQAKPSKTVVVLSTRHEGGVCQIDGKKKPESDPYYNKNKGVSTNAGCRRLPPGIAMFFDSLDLACIGA